jgi:hypothetical protein
MDGELSDAACESLRLCEENFCLIALSRAERDTNDRLGQGCPPATEYGAARCETDP